MAIYLEDSGYLVLEAEDGQQGLDYFCENAPDIVLCDLRMPNLDGLEVLKKLHKISPETPVIVISGAGQIHDVVEALRLGAHDYLVKPISDLAVLENSVANALSHRLLAIQNKAYKQELETANKELEKNLLLLQEDQEAGRRAQLQLLPEPKTSIQGFKFEHAIIPSLNLSGDFIDYFQISERFIGFYIADVSGHGAAAAFVTMTLKSLVNQPLRRFRAGLSDLIIDPAEFLAYLNNELINAQINKHITLFYGVIDCHENILHYSVAGQYPAPILISKNNQTLIDDSGFPLGLFDWVSFENKQALIDKKFKLLMVSDGWLEIASKTSEPASEEFLRQYIQEKPVELASMMQLVNDYKNKNLPDDITVFIVEKE